LTQACQDRFGSRFQIVPEYPGSVPGRRFKLDIAFPDQKVAIEIDGWAHHGKHKAAHAKDRDRQNLLVLSGWRILRYSIGQIANDMDLCLSQIETLLATTRGEENNDSV
jgi:very-short-patch-repair endonuclease